MSPHPATTPDWIRISAIRQPALSVIMAAWQAEKFIAETISSILCQTGIAFELIVLDDASGDKTLDAALAFDDPRLSIGTLPQRIPAGAVRNRAIQQAKAPWLCIFDADDIMLPNTLAPYFAASTENPGTSWAYCSLTLTDSSGSDLNQQMGNPFDLLKMLQRNIVSHPMCLYTRALFNEAGQYNETLPREQDYDLWLRFLLHADPFFYNRTCVRYRRHEGTLGQTASAQKDSLKTRDTMIRLLVQGRGCIPPERQQLLQAALDFLEASDQHRWNETILAGQRLEGLGCRGFERDQRMIRALANKARPDLALTLLAPWMQKAASAEPLLPHERAWIVATGTTLLQTLQTKAPPDRCPATPS